MELRAAKGIYMDIDRVSHAQKVWIPEEQTIVLSRNVEFDLTEFPITEMKEG